MSDEDKDKELEKDVEALSLDLAGKLEKGGISIEQMEKELEDFLTKEV